MGRGKGRRNRTHTSRLVKRTIRLRYSRMEICGTDAEWKREMLSLGRRTVDHRIKMIHAPAATKEKKVNKIRVKVSYAS